MVYMGDKITKLSRIITLFLHFLSFCALLFVTFGFAELTLHSEKTILSFRSYFVCLQSFQCFGIKAINSPFFHGHGS